MILQALQSLIGTVPQGYESLEYVAAAAILLFVIGNIFYGFYLIIKRIGNILRCVHILPILLMMR